MPELKILICESHAVTHEALTLVLAAQGCRLAHAYTGSEAIACVTEFAPDLILLGMVLPDVDGLAVLRRLRTLATTCTTPVVAISSAVPGDLLEKRCAEQKVLGILQRPVDLSELQRLMLLAENGLTADCSGENAALILAESAGSIKTLERALKSEGLHPVYVKRSVEAIAMLNVAKPRLIVLQLGSAPEFAAPLLEHLTARASLSIPVIAIAGVVDAATVQLLTRFGVNDILVEPVPTVRLCRAVERALHENSAPLVAGGLNSILLVEDAALVAKMLSQLLEQGGYRVVQARSAEDAIGAIQKSTPELILLDLVLPGMDGVAFVQQLQQANIRVPVAVVTGSNHPGKLKEVRDLGVIKVFEKPIRSEDLLRFVDGFFAHGAANPATAAIS